MIRCLIYLFGLLTESYQSSGLAGRQAGRAKVATAICPYCKQSIPEAEMSEHIRIELLDPRYREQQQHLEHLEHP